VTSLRSFDDDGLKTPEVGEWGEEKYQLVRCYAQIFARSMKNNFECRVYVDLFAGAGRARLADSRRIVHASPLLALGIEDPFDRYIFCEIDDDKLSALRKRVQKDYPSRDVRFVPGDSNSEVINVLKHVPQHSTTYRVLTFCFVDPCNIANLKFPTIDRLAAGHRLIDFLILIPSGMDAQRNWQRDNSLYSEFLGNSDWRLKWSDQPQSRAFANFFVDQFASSMTGIGFRWEGLGSTEIFKNEKNSTMYHLAFFSRNQLAARFWDDCKRYSRAQTKLPFRS
jgi:three-Cys-motif partner protein